jgi:hypothetical protein
MVFNSAFKGLKTIRRNIIPSSLRALKTNVCARAGQKKKEAQESPAYHFK